MSPNSNTQSCSETNWTEEKKLLPSDGEAGDNFGCYVSLSGDTALTGAWLDGDNGYHSGSAYVFTRTGTTWTQQQKLLPSDGTESDLFGWSVSLDNDTALIGAYWNDDNGADSGSAYVFTRTGTTWTQQAKLLASDGAITDYFGYSVSLSGDTALIGAVCDDDNGDASGSAYAFTRTGTTWTQQAKLLASDGASGDNFGNRVFLANDTALIGEDGDDGIRGSAYVFTRTGTTWTQQAKLLASDGQGEDFFGHFVTLSGDTALIGAPGDDDNGDSSGSAYVFTRTGTTWTQQAKLLASDGYVWDYFGYSVSLIDDTAIVTAPQDDDKGTDSGSAYVYTRTGTSWTQQKKLLASDGQEGDTFGWWSVSLNGNSALISSSRDDDNGLDSGSAYVFTNVNENQPPVADFSWTPQNPSPKQHIAFDASVSHDPDGAIALYEWDWDNDGTYEENHATPTASHSWDSEGSYPVTVRVTDHFDATGTLTKTVNVTGSINFNITITGGFGITAVITNTGCITATSIHWTFRLTGGLLILGKTKSGTLIPMEPGATMTIKDTPIVGFGKVTIEVDLTCAEGISATKTKIGTVILFFVLGIK